MPFFRPDSQGGLLTNPLFMIGQGLLQSSVGPNPYGGISRGLLGMQQAKGQMARQNYYDLQAQQMRQQMEAEARERQRAEEQERMRREAMGQLPPEMQTLLGAFPNAAPQVISQYMKPPQEKERRIVKGADGFQYYADSGERVLPDIQAQPDADAGKRLFEVADKLRDEYTKQSQDFVDVRDAFRKINSASPTPAGDMSLIFGYMKMLDPGSTVREGEFANAENAAGIPERVRQQYNKALKGDKLTGSQRLDFKKEAANVYQAQLSSQQSLMGRYTGLANQFGADPSGVVFDYGAGVEVPDYSGVVIDFSDLEAN